MESKSCTCRNLIIQGTYICQFGDPQPFVYSNMLIYTSPPGGALENVVPTYSRGITGLHHPKPTNAFMSQLRLWRW